MELYEVEEKCPCTHSMALEMMREEEAL